MGRYEEEQGGGRRRKPCECGLDGFVVVDPRPAKPEADEGGDAVEEREHNEADEGDLFWKESQREERTESNEERTFPGDDVPAEANTPPVFWWYNQMGYGERWNNPEWSDRSMVRSFDEYMEAAIKAGWWDGLDHPRKEATPQVYIECGGNTFRRTRGGKKAMAGLWSRLKTVIAIDFKLNSTVQNADYFLPAAQHYEKVAFSIPSPFVANLTLGDKVVEPAGEARNEWEIFLAILTGMSKRAKERGLETYTMPDGTVMRYDHMVPGYTMGGYYLSLIPISEPTRPY